MLNRSDLLSVVAIIVCGLYDGACHRTSRSVVVQRRGDEWGRFHVGSADRWGRLARGYWMQDYVRQDREFLLVLVNPEGYTFDDKWPGARAN